MVAARFPARSDERELAARGALFDPTRGIRAAQLPDVVPDFFAGASRSRSRAPLMMLPSA